MKSEDLLTLTERHWRAIDKLSEALAETADLQAALEIGINILLEALDRPGAALFLPRFCAHITPVWTSCNVPPAWEQELPDPNTGLGTVLSHVMKTGEIHPGNPAFDLAAAFPLHTQKQIAGAIIVRGPVIPPTSYSLWLALLRPIARWVTLHINACGGLDGAPSHLELLRSRNTLRAMFDNMPIGIYIIDREHNLVAVNTSRAVQVGHEPRQLVNRRCYEALYQREEPCPGCRAAETLNSGLSSQRLNRYWLDSDRFIELEINTFPILDEQEAINQAILVEIDVTEKRNLEANLIQAEKLAAVGQLAAGVAHEINNPLTAILANAQLLRREVPPGEADLIESVKLIELAGTRALQVVRNMLGIARKEKYEFAPVDLNDTLHNALSLVQHELVGRPVQIYLSLEDDFPLLMASKDQLQGVWINLILNAIDAIDKENGQISINSHFTGSEYQVTITDNGRGISPDYLERVFEPFFTTKSAGRGTGLGLWVCLRVIHQHGGDIRVESQAGSWTRFTVILPAKK